MRTMAAFVDELVKISTVAEVAAGAGKGVLPFLKTHGKTLGLLGVGATGYHLGKKELEKYQLGRRVYQQMQGQGQ